MRELERRMKLEQLNRDRWRDGHPPLDDLGEPSEPESEGSDDEAFVARSPSCNTSGLKTKVNHYSSLDKNN